MDVGKRDLLLLVLTVGGVGLLGAGVLSPVRSSSGRAKDTVAARASDLKASVESIDAAFDADLARRSIVPAPPADELAIARRLSLALCGTIPSLEEIRRFEARPPAGRLESWLDDLLGDPRFSDYLAERLARAYVGTEDGPFIVFRRRRFVNWLSEALRKNRRYDAIVRDLIADEGLWTDHPATNFITVTFDPDMGRPTPDRLAARVSRAFLGVRIDCAQCHDHPFQKWKQDDFRGLAAFFGGVYSNLRGIHDQQNDYKPADRKTREPVLIEPKVPFCQDLRPSTGSPRQQLAEWVVNPKNEHFARATVNRVWALLFGRPLAEPVDDLPAQAELHPALTLLATDFSAHGYDLRRLIRVITATKVFRRESAVSEGAPESIEEAWGTFPLTRLRPDQVAGALFQATSLGTLGSQSHWFIRLISYTGRNDFVKRYGDTGEDEFDARAGTIPQRLLLMNGKIISERIKDDIFTVPPRIARLAPDDAHAVEAVYLAVLTRKPTADESAHFVGRLAGTSGADRNGRLIDLYWTLLNSTEFSWNH
jgi:hypothetical protein